jgi:hypothetical protein
VTAATQADIEVRSPRSTRVVSPAGARLLLIELRRSTMPLMLPLIAALFWFDSYRPSTGQPAVWVLRTFWNMGQGHTIIDFGPFVAGVAAWMGSRDHRRGTADLVTATPRPRWAAQLTTWAATAIWAVGAYLVFVAVMFEVYERQGMVGSPPWWWVAVGATAVAMFSVVGFAIGAFFPSRFAAPLAAFVGFLTMAMSSQTGFGASSGWALILPTNSNGNYGADSGIFYPLLPDLPIARTMFLAGIALAALGLIGLPAGAGGPWLRRVAALVLACGVAAAGTAAWLATTARLQPNGMVIPALHDAANDRPISYRPDCARATIEVCVNPVYRADLAGVTAAVGPVAREIAGLSGAPVRATGVAIYYTTSRQAPFSDPSHAVTILGRPPVLRLALGAIGLVGAFGLDPQDLADQVKLRFVHAIVGAGTGPGTLAQQAVQAALLERAGLPFVSQPNELAIDGLPTSSPPASHGPARTGPAPATGPVYVAAERLTALPPAALHAWLAAHLAALRSGQLTLAQLP